VPIRSISLHKKAFAERIIKSFPGIQLAFHDFKEGGSPSVLHSPAVPFVERLLREGCTVNVVLRMNAPTTCKLLTEDLVVNAITYLNVVVPLPCDGRICTPSAPFCALRAGKDLVK